MLCSVLWMCHNADKCVCVCRVRLVVTKGNLTMKLAKNKTMSILYSAKLKDQIPRLKDQIHEQTVQQEVIHEQTEGLDS